MSRTPTITTRPCEGCGVDVSKTKTQQSQRKYWTCSRQCARRLGAPARATHWNPNPYRGQRDTRPCAVCSTEVTRYLSQATAVRPWTCSRRCQAIQRHSILVAEGRWHRPEKPRRGQEVDCESCGRSYYRGPNATQRFCSRECQSDGQRKPPVVKSCGWCGKELRLKPSQGSIQFCSRRCMGEAKISRPLERTHNGRRARLDRLGYVLVWQPDFPAPAANKGWVYEHRFIAAQMLGRPLTSEEQVDHINRDKADNRPENLQVLDGQGHSFKTQADQRLDRNDLAEYRNRYGPLPT